MVKNTHDTNNIIVPDGKGGHITLAPGESFPPEDAPKKATKKGESE